VVVLVALAAQMFHSAFGSDLDTGYGASSRAMKPVRIESLLAGVLNVGTWLASVVIAAGLVLSFFHEQMTSPTGAQVVTAGIGLLILRVIIMRTIFVKKHDYKFAAAAAVVLVMIIAGFAVGILSK